MKRPPHLLHLLPGPSWFGATKHGAVTTRDQRSLHPELTPTPPLREKAGKSRFLSSAEVPQARKARKTGQDGPRQGLRGSGRYGVHTGRIDWLDYGLPSRHLPNLGVCTCVAALAMSTFFYATLQSQRALGTALECTNAGCTCTCGRGCGCDSVRSCDSVLHASVLPMQAISYANLLPSPYF